MIPLYILVSLLLLTSGAIAWKLFQPTEDNSEEKLRAKDQEIGQLKQEIQELTNNGKHLFANHEALKGDVKALQQEREMLSNRVARFEAEAEAKTKRHEDMAKQLDNVKQALEDEKVRIRREDEERQQQLLAARDRMWNDHEQDVIAQLNELTKKEHCQFPSYTNTNLPEEFSGSLKPDYMIGFLQQYVIFDAKVSRSQDLQNYMKESVKKTAAKLKGNQHIYPTVYLVVPTDAIADLKQLSFYEEGFTFYIISPDALEPILASFKRIEQYEFAEAMDPQERENIVDLIAAFHFHISSRNAHELGLMLHGLETLDKAEKMHPELLAEAIVKKAKMRHVNLNTADTKGLVANPKEVAEQLKQLVEPSPKISTDDLGTE